MEINLTREDLLVLIENQKLTVNQIDKYTKKGMFLTSHWIWNRNMLSYMLRDELYVLLLEIKNDL